MVRIILFDLDNTILDFNRAEANAIHKTLKSLGIEPSADNKKRYSEINLSQWKLLERGEITRAELLTRRFDLLFEELKVKRDSLLAWNTYERELSGGCYFMDGAKELLNELEKRQQYRLFIVSNGTASVQEGRIKGAKLKKYFEDIFISELIGYNKPDKRFFDYCFAHIKDFHREETLLVGDSLSSDILGGINAGIPTCWFHGEGITNGTDIIPDFEITRLSKLLAII